MTSVSARSKNIISGLIALVVLFASITLGVKYAFGSFNGGYSLTGSFAAAGQGLIDGSDVKIRGVNVGEVTGIELIDGRALVTMRIDSHQRVPRTASAVIRPKTLFGEKFVDIVPGDAEASGPYYGDGDRIEDTLGGFELERVLADTYPILQAIDPAEVATVLSTLSDGSKGLGEAINRQIVNGQILTDIQVKHDADLRQFLTDLDALATELSGRSDDVVSLATNLNDALPTLNENAGDLTSLLEQTARLSGDLADIIDNNHPFIDAAFAEGQRTIDALYEQRTQVVPLVIGLRQYFQVLSEIVRIEGADEGLMAAVKGILGGAVCDLVTCPGTGQSGLLPELPIEAPPPLIDAAPDADLDVAAVLDDLLRQLDELGTGVTTGVDAVLQLVLGLGGPR